jgi:hypothetical protein
MFYIHVHKSELFTSLHYSLLVDLKLYFSGGGAWSNRGGAWSSRGGAWSSRGGAWSIYRWGMVHVGEGHGPVREGHGPVGVGHGAMDKASACCKVARGSNPRGPGLPK